MKKSFLLPVLLLLHCNAISQGTLYYNGRIFTGDSIAPWAKWFIVENGKITQTGLQGEPRWDTFSSRVDLQSKTVIPGIIDSHIHFIDGGLSLLQVSFRNTVTRNDFIETLRSAQNELVDGTFIGRDLPASALKDIGKPIELLDNLMADTPAIIFLKGGHAAISNTAAMRKLGFGRNKVVADGTIERDSAGNATGVLLEGAAMEANHIITLANSSETIQNAIMRAQALALSYGITTIGDNTFNPAFFKIYQELQKGNFLKIRVRARSYGRIPQTEELMKNVGKKHIGLIGGGVDEARVKYHAMKFFVDEALSREVQSHKPGAPGGKIFLNSDQLKEIFELHPHSTFAFHAQGEESIQNILDVVARERAASLMPRHIIDHAGYGSPEQMRRAADLGVGITIIGGQLFDYKGVSSFYRLEHQFRENYLLNTRVKVHNARAALTSDFPYGMDTLFTGFSQVDGLNPFPVMAVQVTGRYPDGSKITGVENKTISLQEAVNAFTVNGAYVLGEERRLGKLAAGYYADFVVLQEDIFSKREIDLYDARVSKTFIQGEQVYDATAPVQIRPLAIRVRPSDYAISPIIGYDPSLGLILGGAYFRYPLATPGNYFDAQIQAIPEGKLSVQSTFVRFDLFRKTNLSISGSYSNFFQYYFGEGAQTDASKYAKLFAQTYRLRPELTRRLDHDIRLSAFAEIRGRKETKVTDKNGVDLNTTFFPDENTVALGFVLQHDNRDNAYSTKKGNLTQLSFQYVPAGLNVPNLGDVMQITAETRYFRYVGNSNFILASRLAGGFSVGTPSYLFRYTLGGPYAMRGYYSNRFRGDKYYVAQAEGRFPIYKRFSGVVFCDAGDVTDTEFDKPKLTYGAGLRFALNENIKLRLDYGIARDQTGVFFTFSEAF